MNGVARMQAVRLMSVVAVLFFLPAAAALAEQSRLASPAPAPGSGIDFGPAVVGSSDIPVPQGVQDDPSDTDDSDSSTSDAPTQGAGNSDPQVVTTSTPKTSAAVTAEPPTSAPAVPKAPPICTNLPGLTAVPATMGRSSAGVCTPKCLNHPDFTYLPDRWYKQDGNCYVRVDDYGMCHGDQYQLVTFDNVDHMLATGYNMGIIVNTPDPLRRLNCIITDLATYGLDPNGYVFSGKYVQDGWPQDSQTFDTPTPYPWSAWKPLYPLWVQKTQIKQYAVKQSVASIQAYGLLWGTNRYQTVTSFARRLKATGGRWKGWKHNHPVLAAALLSHVSLLRR